MTATLDAVTKPEYYLRGDHLLTYLAGSAKIGFWYGKGAEKLGYQGDLTAEQFCRAFAGLSPDGTRSLVQVQTGKTRQPAWDMTFSVPKGMSVLWSRLDAYHRQQLEDIVLRSVKRALDYLNAEALKTRRGHRGAFVENADGVFALFLHGVSRTLDPQLHFHTIIFNLCARHDSTSATIRSHDLYLHKMAAGAIFRAELAHLLATELGLTIIPDGWKFRIAGIPESLCDEFSKRRKAIEALAMEKGWSNPEVLAQLALATRQPKKEVPLSECLAQWAATADKHGFTRDVAVALLAAGQKKLASRATITTQPATLAAITGDSRIHSQAPLKGRSKLLTHNRLRTADAVAIETTHGKVSEAIDSNFDNASQLFDAFNQSVVALAAFKSHFPERDLVRETATRALAYGASATQILEAVKNGTRRFENRVLIENSCYISFSTKQNIAAEKELLTSAYQGIESSEHIAQQTSVQKAITNSERKLSRQLGVAVAFTEEQKQAVRHITLEPGDTKLVQGYAGSGKTQMLEAAHAAWKASGYRVLGTTITGRAAVGLEKSTGIPSVTVEFLLRRLRPNLTATEFAKLIAWNSQEAIKAHYYEGIRAGKWMQSPLKQACREASRGLVNLVSGVGKSNKLPDCQLTSKTILVVDEAAMLPTRTLLAIQQECRRFGAKLVLVGDKLQLPAIQAGGPFESLAKRIGHCSLTTIVRQKHKWMREATKLLIDNEPQQALECYAANGALYLARHQRAAMEKLISDYGGLPAEKFSKAIAITATNEESRLINQGVQLKRKAAKQLGLHSVRLPNGERAFMGDRVMLTLNDYRLNVRNGILATVVGITHKRGLVGPSSLTLRLDDQHENGFVLPKVRTISIDLKQYSKLQLGYAATTHKLQGVTVETSFVLMGDVMLSKERAFTQLTRASHASTIYAAEARHGDAIQLLAQQISKKTAKDLAHDHQVVHQPQSNIKHSRSLRQEVLHELLPDSTTAQNSTAGLTKVKLSRHHMAALWALVADLGKLRGNDFQSTVAIVTDAAEVSRINLGVQSRRKAAQDLGIDSMRLPQGERVFKKDRVLLSIESKQGIAHTVFGTVIGMRSAHGVLADSQLTVQLDAQLHNQTAGTVTVQGSELAKIQLGYAATSQQLGGASVSTSYVLLPEGGGTPEAIRTQLAHATHNVCLYGQQARYGSLLATGKDHTVDMTALEATRSKETNQFLQFEEQSRLQRRQDEEQQLTSQQSITL